MKKNRKWLRYILCMFVMIFCCIIFIGYCRHYYVNVNDIVMEEARSNIVTSTKHGGDIIKYRLLINLKATDDIAHVLSSGEYNSLGSALGYINDYIKDGSFDYMGIVDKDGNTTLSNGMKFNVADQKEFPLTMKGNKTISEPFPHRGTGEPIITINSPIYKNNKVTSYVRSDLLVSNIQELLRKSLSSSEGYSLIMNEDGDILFVSGEDIPLGNKYNIFNDVDLNNSNGYNEYLQKDMLKQGDGVKKISINGEEYFFGYSKIEGICDWYYASIVPLRVPMENTKAVLSLTMELLFGTVVIFVIGCIGIIIKQARDNSKIRNIAYTDKLTGIPNKNKFITDSTKYVNKNYNLNYAAICFDINRFGYINILYGFDVADDVLKKIAEVLKNNIDEKELYARYKDDVFTLLIHYDEDEDITKRLYDIYDDIMIETMDTIPDFYITFSSGIRKIDEFSLEMEHVIDRANYARIKYKGKYNNSNAFFDDELLVQTQKIREIEINMHKALINDEFKLYIQPKIDFKSEEIIGGEALVRWQSPEFGFMPPNEFIEVFESNGFIRDLDYYMLENVCKKIKEWKSSGIKIYPISVNFSQLHLYEADFVARVNKICQKYSVESKYIEIEMTERALSNKNDTLLPMINEFHELGFTISMDDFGTGISSLSVLKDIPVDSIKIDKSFLDGEDSERIQSVIAKMIELAKSLNMKVVSEGVETEEQIAFLKEMECDIAQGYFYARPMKVEDYVEFISKSNSEK